MAGTATITGKGDAVCLILYCHRCMVFNFICDDSLIWCDGWEGGININSGVMAGKEESI